MARPRRLPSPRFVLAIALAGVVGAGYPSVASAEDTKEAVERFEKGVGLYQAGAFEGALIEFDVAYKSSGNYRILFNIALCKMESRDPVGALAAFRRYLAEGGDRIDAARRATVEAFVKKLEPAVVSLVVRTDAPPGAEVTVDDERVATTPVSGPVAIKAGRHRVSIRFGERRVEKTIEAPSGESATVDLPLPPAATRGASSASTAAPPTTTKGNEDGASLLWVPWAVAGGLGIASIATGIIAVDSRNDAETARATYGATRADIDTPADKARALGLATDVLLASTVVAAGVATYFTIKAVTRPTDDGHGAKPTARVGLGPFGLGLAVRGEL
ncbi:MAG: PEGA domain-containing protein [Myxococcales bacterium]|nr:PEGA domain-containing protein [Myxococcales bacterium]